MEFLDFLNTYWHVLTGVVLIVIGAVKFFFDMKALQKRVHTVENKLAENFENDTSSKEEMTSQMTVMGAKIDNIIKAVKALLKHNGIPDIL